MTTRRMNGAAPEVREQPHVQAYSLPSLKPRVVQPAVSIARVSAPLIYTPVLTCQHMTERGAGFSGVMCGGTTFRVADGQTGRRLRCAKCNGLAHTAMCSCGNAYGAHGASGCGGLTDNGEPCSCQLRGGR